MQKEPPEKSIFKTAIAATPNDSTIAELTDKLETERNLRREERFGWILLFVIIFDVFAFYLIQNWTGPIVIGIFEAIGLIVLAKRLGVDEVLPVLDRVLSVLTGKIGS